MEENRSHKSREQRTLASEGDDLGVRTMEVAEQAAGDTSKNQNQKCHVTSEGKSNVMSSDRGAANVKTQAERRTPSEETATKRHEPVSDNVQTKQYFGGSAWNKQKEDLIQSTGKHGDIEGGNSDEIQARSHSTNRREKEIVDAPRELHLSKDEGAVGPARGQLTGTIARIAHSVQSSPGPRRSGERGVVDASGKQCQPEEANKGNADLNENGGEKERTFRHVKEENGYHLKNYQPGQDIISETIGVSAQQHTQQKEVKERMFPKSTSHVQNYSNKQTPGSQNVDKNFKIQNGKNSLQKNQYAKPVTGSVTNPKGQESVNVKQMQHTTESGSQEKSDIQGKSFQENSGRYHEKSGNQEKHIQGNYGSYEKSGSHGKNIQENTGRYHEKSGSHGKNIQENTGRYHEKSGSHGKNIQENTGRYHEKSGNQEKNNQEKAIHKQIDKQNSLPINNRGGSGGRNMQVTHRQQGAQSSRSSQPHYLPPPLRHTSPRHHAPWQPPVPQTHTRPRSLVCGACRKDYNLDEKLPRNLFCGHSICASCVRRQLGSGEVDCLSCPTKTWYVKNINDCPVNQPLVKWLQRSTEKGSNNRMQRQQQPKSLPERSLDTNKIQSPHGSQCVEQGVRPSCYCSACEVWVCARCAKLDHNRNQCCLKSTKEELVTLKQKNEESIHVTSDLLTKSLQDLESSYNHQDLLLLGMRAAFEFVGRKQEDIKANIQEGKRMKNTLDDAMSKAAEVQNLPQALAHFKASEDQASVAQQWATSAKPTAASGDQLSMCLKSLMRVTLQSLQPQHGELPQLVASHSVASCEQFSKLSVDGGRFHLHCLRNIKPTKDGTRAIPLKCFKLCMDGGSSVAFLDLSWGGILQGRVYIRLAADTLHGHQFFSLCTGEAGPSLLNTPFHRVWWKGLPGEHVWAGDYEKGDGSGGGSLHSTSRQRRRRVAISAGLVAGRYTVDDTSSMFRIYTRGDKEATDEAGFGQVEYGLEVVQKAIKLRNITDVTITDCGIVLEL